LYSLGIYQAAAKGIWQEKQVKMKALLFIEQVKMNTEEDVRGDHQ